MMSIPYSRYVFGSLPWYGLLIVCGMLAAISLCIHEEKRLGLKPDTIIDAAFWVIPFGIVGARLYYVIFQWELFAPNPLSILRLWEGGLAIYGGIIGGLIAMVLFAKRRKINPFVLTDLTVPGLALAQSIGRWGNYFNMEAYGREISNAAWQFFPIGVQIASADGYTWHMATFFYESVWNLLVFLLLWFVIRKHGKTAGTATLWYMLLYGTGRFLIEPLRTDSLMSGSVRVSQLLSLALVVASAAALLILAFRRKKTT